MLINNQCSLLIVILKLNKYKGLIMEFEKLDTRLEMQAVFLPDGTEVDSDAAQTPISDDIYYIVPGKCTECKGFHEEPQCAAVCPVDCCIHDDQYNETVEELLSKKDKLHA